MKTEITIWRGDQKTVWIGDMPLIPEGHLITNLPGAAATRITSSSINVGKDNKLTQHLTGS